MEKKIFAIILILFILFALTTCSDENGEVEISEKNEDINMIDDIEEDKINFGYETEHDESIENSNNYYEKLEYIIINGEKFSTELTRLELNCKITEVEFEQLKYMVKLEHLSIIDELGDMYNIYISDISALADLKNLTTLILGFGDYGDINALAGLINLRVLSISSWKINDISALADLINLTELHIRSSSVRDVSVITGLSNLKILTLGSDFISDISPLAELKNLTSLKLRKCRRLSDISPLAELKNLSNLDLADDNRFITAEKVEELKYMLPNLTTLIFNNVVDGSIESFGDYVETGKHITIRGKQYDTGLKRLVLDDVTNSDIEQLIYMVNLEYLTIGLIGTVGRISDISPLAELKNLTSLHLGFNSEIRDVNALAKLTNLTELHIRGSRISDISILAGLTNLEILTFGSYSSNLDISPLAELKNLTSLHLRFYNRLHDINTLIELENLTVLRLESLRAGGTLLTDEQIKELQEALPNTQIILE